MESTAVPPRDASSTDDAGPRSSDDESPLRPRRTADAAILAGAKRNAADAVARPPVLSSSSSSSSSASVAPPSTDNLSSPVPAPTAAHRPRVSARAAAARSAGDADGASSSSDSNAPYTPTEGTPIPGPMSAPVSLPREPALVLPRIASLGAYNADMDSDRSTAPTRLEEYGCCVFFFPTKVISWLMPFMGHVAISNAEGSRLFTFESSYYVREEWLADVLQGVLPRLRPEVWRKAPRSSGRRRRDSLGPASPLLAVANGQKTKAKPRAGHADAANVLVWDLKPLLMESRGRQSAFVNVPNDERYKTKYSNTRRQQRQQQQQPASPATPIAPVPTAASAAPPAAGEVEAESECAKTSATSGYPSGGSNGASSEDEPDAHRCSCVLNKETRHYFDAKLLETVQLFQGASGAKEIKLEPHSSFSFVGFVLESCGLESNPAKRWRRASMAASATSSDNKNSSSSSSSSSGGGRAPASPLVEETSEWGTLSLLASLFFTGTWLYSERRWWRALHGGSMWVAALLNLALLYLAYVFLLPLAGPTVSSLWSLVHGGSTNSSGVGNSSVGDPSSSLPVSTFSANDL